MKQSRTQIKDPKDIRIWIEKVKNKKKTSKEIVYNKYDEAFSRTKQKIHKNRRPEKDIKFWMYNKIIFFYT